jgi:protocatechuate 3,4-dioxygenase beta subunit
VYLWHCDAAGSYSMYSGSALAQNYLRGVQAAGTDGQVRFTTIFPGCYAGRWPHIHFEVFATLAQASAGSATLRVSQLAVPEAISREVYAGSGYGSSLNNLNGISLTSDNVFSDGVSLQMATMSGTVASGLTATLDVVV